jgi:hypothetical protein
MNFNELDNFGISDEMHNFDPTGGILDETPTNRGQWDAGNSGKDAVFTVQIQNATDKVLPVEMFGAANSIVEIPNPSAYPNGYKPFTTKQTLALIGQLAVTADAGRPAIQPTAMVIWDDSNGNLVYIDGSFFPLSQWATFFTSQLPLAWNTPGVELIVSCLQRPYKAFMADLKDLVLHIRMMRIRFSNVAGIDYPLSYDRPKSFGGADSNTNEVLTYQSPQNQLTNVVDVPTQFYVDKLTTVRTQVADNGGANYSQTSYNYWVSAYRNNGLVS